MTNHHKDIRVIVGLGNPGPQFFYTRHNIGFRIVDALAERYQGNWHDKKLFDYADIVINGKPVALIKPKTFMNLSGQIAPFLQQKGWKREQLLVVHDELEKPFGSIGFKEGGSHRGHNGVRSMIASCGDAFLRLRFGIGRPADKTAVDTYVIGKFAESMDDIDAGIDRAVAAIEALF